MKHVFGNSLCRGFYGKYLYLEGLSDVAYSYAGTDKTAGTVRTQVDGIHASGHQHPMAAGGVVEIIITAFATDFQFDGSGGFFSSKNTVLMRTVSFSDRVSVRAGLPLPTSFRTRNCILRFVTR